MRKKRMYWVGALISCFCEGDGKLGLAWLTGRSLYQWRFEKVLLKEMGVEKIHG